MVTVVEQINTEITNNRTTTKTRRTADTVIEMKTTETFNRTDTVEIGQADKNH